MIEEAADQYDTAFCLGTPIGQNTLFSSSNMFSVLFFLQRYEEKLKVERGKLKI